MADGSVWFIPFKGAGPEIYEPQRIAPRLSVYLRGRQPSGLRQLQHCFKPSQSRDQLLNLGSFLKGSATQATAGA